MTARPNSSVCMTLRLNLHPKVFSLFYRKAFFERKLPAGIHLFQILTLSPLADRMAVLSELKHNVLTSLLCPGSPSLVIPWGSFCFWSSPRLKCCNMLLFRRTKLCWWKKKLEAQKYCFSLLLSCSADRFIINNNKRKTQKIYMYHFFSFEI
jgi:hypothetical protein